MKKLFFLIFISILCPLSYAECLSNDIQINKINQLMKNMVSCWNQADVDCALVQPYREDAIYIAKTGPIFGKKNIVNYFSDAFRDKETGKINLGTLKLTVLWCKKIDSNHVLTLQQYRFKANKSAGLREGYDTLIWEKTNGHWLITYDHPRDK